MSSRHWILALIIPTLAAPAAAGIAHPDDDVELRVRKAGGGGIDLAWTGDAGLYEVRRGLTPGGAWADADGRLGETGGFGWSDSPPGADIVYYVINPTGRCFSAAEDTAVDSSLPNQNFGLDEQLDVARLTGTSPVTRRAYLRFDLGAIPAGSTIESATLEMLVGETGGPFGGPRDWRALVYRVLEPWSQTSLRWSTQPAYDTHADGDRLLPVSPDWMRWDLTGLTRDWLSGAGANHGVMVATQTFDAELIFYSHEANEQSRPGDPHRAPRLCVDWSAPADAEISRLREASAAEPRLESASVRPEFLSGDVAVRTSSADPVVQALDHLQDFRDLYGLRDPQAELYLERVRAGESAAMAWDLFFGQRIENVPVFGAFVDVHVDQGRIQVSGGNWLPAVQKGRVPRAARVSLEQARELARSAVPGSTDGEFGMPRLVYFSPELVTWQPGRPQYQPGQPVHLTWQIGVTGLADTGPTRWLVLVDAVDGATRLVQEQDESACSKPRKEDIDVQTVNYTTSRTCWNFQTADDRWFTENGATGNYSSSADPFQDGINAFNYSFDVYDFYYRNFCRRSINGKNGQMETMVQWNDGGRPNAFWSNGCGHMVYSDGYVTPDIFGHEFRHGIDSKEAKLIYVDQSGALDESLADFFGTMIDFEYDDRDWFIGEDLPGTGGCTNAPAPSLRNMADPPDCFSNLANASHPDHRANLIPPPATSTRDRTNDNGWVHVNSGLPNKVAFLITDGGIHNALNVNGIGRGKAWDLYHWTHVERLGKSSSFRDMRNEMIDLARDWADLGLRGFTNADVCDVINAWSSVGYGNPDTDCDGQPGGFDGDNDGRRDEDDNCVNMSNWDQSDIDGDGTGDICDDDVDGDGVLNRDDNCRLDANADQADGNGDGVGDVCADDDGDGVLTTEDNCPGTPNGACSFYDDELCDIDGDGQTDDAEYRLGLQRDEDGDGQGDACDGDIDDDGIPNASDYCDYDDRGGATDGDEDGVGDICDNCLSVYNPDQADADGDEEGDVCDTDRDGDGYANEVDNCPDASNESQADNDGNGVGFACDFGEWAYFDGLRSLVELDMFFQFNDPLEPVRFEVFPCTDNCPDWIRPGFETRIAIEMDRPLNARVVDSDGAVMTQGRYAETHELVFAVDADYSYVSPALNDVPYESEDALERAQMRRYFLEFWLPEDMDPRDVQGIVDVTSIPE